jgi:N-acetylglucosaminyldiphosphoundecaprenol N-acetyl-beta-D-mannosaminyltransferase
VTISKTPLMSANLPIKRVQVFGLSVFSDDLDRIPLTSPCATIATISPNSYGIATKDADFREALAGADYLVLDGVYFGLASILLERRFIKPNQGPDVFSFFIRKLNALHGRAFFLGSSNETLQKIKSRAATEHPNVAVEVYSPPFKPEFDDEDNRRMLDKISAFGPDIVFIGMTAPKQEKWAHKHRDRISAKLVVSVGAVFDWYAGNERPVAPIWWSLKLGWLVRTIRRPEILKRYPSIFIFFRHLFLAVLGIKKYSNGKS